MSASAARGVVCLLLLVAFGCNRPSTDSQGALPLPERPQYLNPKPEPWSVVCTDPTHPEPALVTNGHLALRIGRDGFPVGGVVLADDYDLGPEEKLRFDRPNPFPGRWELDGKPIDWRKVQDYEQRLDFKTGLLTTQFRYEGILAGTEVMLSSLRQAGIRAWVEVGTTKLAPNFDTFPTYPGFPFASKLGTDQDGQRNGAWRLASFGLPKEWMTVAAPFLAAADMMSDFDQPKRLPSNFQAFLVPSKEDALYDNGFDVEIDGPIEDQQAIRSFVYYLQAGIPKGYMGAGPFGLSNSTYFGHIFWDADVWMFPVAALMNGYLAEQFTGYRFWSRMQYGKNFDEWYFQKFGGKPSKPGMMAPWESSWSGKETVPGPSRKQHHITGSVAWMLEHASALGLGYANDMVKQAAEFYRYRSVEGPQGREIKDTMSPDEFHIGDNDLYTNLLAEWVMRRAGDETVNFQKPRDETTFLTYDRDPLRKGYKQAAAVLAIYPLQHRQAEAESKLMMDRFADKVIDNGPAMTHSIHALIWARLGEREKAYETWRKSWQDYTRLPLLLFSEKTRKPVTYFLTGAGGCLQTVLYGFAGIRISDVEPKDVKWKLPLRNDFWISIKPNLPPAWKSMKIHRLIILRKPYDLVITQDSFQINPSSRLPNGGF